MNSDSKFPKTLWRIVSVASLVAFVAYLDYITGVQVHLGAIYAVTVGVATWYLGLSFGIAVSLIDTALVGWIEHLTGMVYAAKWAIYVNSLSRCTLFLFVAFSFSYFRRTIALAHKRVQAFEGKLHICSCCNRVNGGGGFWMDFPTYLRKNSEVIPEFDTCPQCERVQEKAGSDKA